MSKRVLQAALHGIHFNKMVSTAAFFFFLVSFPLQFLCFFLIKRGGGGGVEEEASTGRQMVNMDEARP